jgi:hypothetical protein
MPLRFKYSVEMQNGAVESDSAAQLLEHYASLTPLDTSPCPVVQMPSVANSGLDCQSRHIDLDNSEMSSCSSVKLENSQESLLASLDDFVSVHWSDTGFGWHQCGVCGYTKLTCCQGETFKKEKVWLCEDCHTEWEKRREPN